MKNSFHSLKTLLLVCLAASSLQLSAAGDGSVYTQRPVDPEAFYFTPENYPIRADGKTDVSDALQTAASPRWPPSPRPPSTMCRPCPAWSRG